LHEYVLGSILEFKLNENKKLLAKYVFPNLLKDKLKFGKNLNTVQLALTGRAL